MIGKLKYGALGLVLLYLSYWYLNSFGWNTKFGNDPLYFIICRVAVIVIAFAGALFYESYRLIRRK